MLLNELPTEVLSQIISSLDIHRDERIIGHIPDDPPPSEPDSFLIQDFLSSCTALCNLSLTNRRFRDIAQKYMFFAPVVASVTIQNPTDIVHARIAYFLRTIIARPDLINNVRRIRLYFPGDDPHEERIDEKLESNTKAEAVDFAMVMHQFRNILASLQVPEDFKSTWNSHLIQELCFTMLGFIIALLPRLEVLTISIGRRQLLDNFTFLPNLIGIQSPYGSGHIGLPVMLCLPAVDSIRQVKTCSLGPFGLDGLDKFPNLETLDISMRLPDPKLVMVKKLKLMYSKFAASNSFSRIRHLRLDCQVKSVGIWDCAARVSMTHILQAFSKLSNLEFYGEPSCEKNPFRSVRAFPQYQTNIQTHPDLPSPTDMDAALQSQNWDERVYDARTQWTDYQHLVDSLVHLRPHLETLKLPGGFWTLPGAMRKPLPRFDLFLQLRSLILPQAAIISIKLDNMRFSDTVHEDFELLPTSVLPSNLQHLRIFDVDVGLLGSSWLEELFHEQAAYCRWLKLLRLEIMFGPAFKDEDLKSFLEKKDYTKLWGFVDTAAFHVRFCRDDEVPLIGM
ncbi:hypothetical protein GQ44DRAFT_825822 [Phaeosphaeriaceae sp. PMI808]|nr:hypothetical protein GQ44DRAFT_825822 [Phaeosphaeriaceae sp. PMI808]